MAEPARPMHNHPQPGPVVIVHSRVSGVPDAEDNPAHAFGPFPSEDAAMAWDLAHPDNCAKSVLDLFDPFEMGLGG